MPKDFVPDSTKNLRDWTQQILDNIDDIATRVSWGGAAAFKTRVTGLNAKAQAVLDAQDALDTATGQLDTAKSANVPEIRKDINNLKTTRGFTDGDADVLDVQTSPSTFDAASYKPVLTVEEKKGYNQLMSKKRGVDSFNAYVRRKGEGTFRLFAAKRVRFPLEDDTASADGKAEEREYQIIGVVGDNEVGQPSNIASAVWRP